MIRSLPALLGAVLVAVAAPTGAQPSRDSALHTFLQERFAEDRASAPDTCYAYGWADLNGDDRPEAFVYVMSRNACGSGGCSLYIYTPEHTGFHQLARTTVTELPVSVLNSRTGGWRDIVVGVSGGGTRARTVILRQQGGTYPDNPTVDGSVPRGNPVGQVVIAADNRGRRLF